MTADTIKQWLDWMRAHGGGEYVDHPILGARRFYLELVGPYLTGKGK